MNHEFEVAIVGAGPAGLSAAIYLGRCCRKVVVFDHGQPRNEAAMAVHGYLGHDGIQPQQLRCLGRQEALRYGVSFVDSEVTAVACLKTQDDRSNGFEITATGQSAVRVQRLLLATGVVDELPPISNIRDFYGTTVHHCPYCDGWEHRDRRLVAYGDGRSAIMLALALKTWSPWVTACTNGNISSDEDLLWLVSNSIALRSEPVIGLQGTDGLLSDVLFSDGPPLACDAMFFHSHQAQRSPLAEMAGCHLDAKAHIDTYKKQFTGVDGVYMAGDADGEVQFAIVAAAEGAIAATAINRDLQDLQRQMPTAKPHLIDGFTSHFPKRP
jgi:thioredoxin reductase